MGKFFGDNAVTLSLALLGYLVAASGLAYCKYAELNEARIRHDERIRVIQSDNMEFDRKQEQMLSDIGAIKVAVVKLATYVENKK
jgi:hypothetical protein